MLGYLKRYAAIECVQNGEAQINIATALRVLQGQMLDIYDPFTWDIDVSKKIEAIQLGEW